MQTATTTRDREVALTIAHQLPWGVKANLGYRDLVSLPADGGTLGGLRFRIGNGRRFAEVRLNAWDLYEARIVTTRGRVEWESPTGLHGLYAEDLGEALIVAHDEVTR